MKLKNLYRKLFKPSFWVCEYWIDPSESSLISKESGQFNCFGMNKEAAYEAAAIYIKDIASVNGECSYLVRKPNLIERLESLV